MCENPELKLTFDLRTIEHLGILDESNNGIYKPNIIKYNEETDKASGTQIVLSGIKRKNQIDIFDLKASIAKRFAFNVPDFKIEISNETNGKLTKN